MPTTTVLTKSKYQTLLTDLKKLIAEGKRRAQQAVGRELVQTYWEVGRRLSRETLTENAGYRQSIFEDVAKGLGLEETTVRKAVHFFNTYPNTAPQGLSLTWAHYKELIFIPQDEARVWYETQAVQMGWTRDQLVSAIKRRAWQDSKEKTTKKKSLTRPTNALYVYKALVERVVDGDTLLVRLDLGFQVWKEQRIRLAAIDCPEKDTQEGRKAFEWVRDRLARVPFVVVKTNKIDIYGRYVGHVFYAYDLEAKEKVFTEGYYLNQELLDQKLAKRV